MKEIVPFLSLAHCNSLIRSQVLASFTSFFDSQHYILGDGVKKFEEQYALFNNVKYCIGVGNGLDALHLALKTLGVGSEDEVIVPAHTFIATVLAVSYCGAKPVFVEPDINTYNIDPAKIEDAITRRTKVILPVHLYGQACDMTSILEISKKHNLHVVEDNAQSQGATWDHQLTGSFGQVNATSFYPTKNLGAFGDAGAITTNSEENYGNLRLLRNYGSEKKYVNDIIGFNSRIDECQAIFLSVKLKLLSNWNDERIKIANQYLGHLKDIGDIIPPTLHEKASSVYHLFVIRTKFRDKLQVFLGKNGIGTMIHYPMPPYRQKCYSDLGTNENTFPITDEISKTCLSLPIYPGLSQEQVSQIVDHIKRFFR